MAATSKQDTQISPPSLGADEIVKCTQTTRVVAQEQQIEVRSRPSPSPDPAISCPARSHSYHHPIQPTQSPEVFGVSADSKTLYSGSLDGRVSALWLSLGKTKQSFFDNGVLETNISWMSNLCLHEQPGQVWLWGCATHIPTLSTFPCPRTSSLIYSNTQTARLFCAGAFEQDTAAGPKFQGIIKCYNLRNKVSIK